MDADAYRQRVRRADDPAQREQHALLVVAGDPRRAGREDELAPVRVDVGGEERNALFFGRRFDCPHQLLERGGGARRDPRARSARRCLRSG